MYVEPDVSVPDQYGRPEVCMTGMLPGDFAAGLGCCPAHGGHLDFAVRARKNERMVPERVLAWSEVVLVFPGRDMRGILPCGQMEELASDYGADNSSPQTIGENRAHQRPARAGLSFRSVTHA